MSFFKCLIFIHTECVASRLVNCGAFKQDPSRCLCAHVIFINAAISRYASGVHGRSCCARWRQRRRRRRLLLALCPLSRSCVPGLSRSGAVRATGWSTWSPLVAVLVLVERAVSPASVTRVIVRFALLPGSDPGVEEARDRGGLA